DSFSASRPPLILGIKHFRGPDNGIGTWACDAARTTRRPCGAIIRSTTMHPESRTTGQENIVITIHHLDVSQSERIVWLMEELGLPYELKWYDRKPDRLAPDELLALHPTAMAPVVVDGDRVLTESAVIVEYI